MVVPSIALLIPDDARCGIYTYSHFLLKAFSASLLVKPVFHSKSLSPFAYYNLGKKLSQEFDLIHVQFEFGRFGKLFFSGIGAPFFFKGLSHSCAVITTIHEIPSYSNSVLQWAHTAILKIIVNRSNVLIVHTQDSFTRLLRRYPFAQNKLLLIPHGLSPVAIASSHRPGYLQDKTVVGFFGFISPHKGVEVILDTLAQLPERFFFLIAGSTLNNQQSAYLDSLHRTVNEKNLSSRVSFYGFVPEDQVNQVFSWMNFVVFPYEKVTESGALHLALAHKKCVLATPLPAFIEIESRYHCITLFSDSADLANKLQHLETNLVEQQRLLHSLDSFLADRDWKAIAERHESVYRALLSHPTAF